MLWAEQEQDLHGGGTVDETGLLAEDGLAKSEGGRRSSLLLIPVRPA